MRKQIQRKPYEQPLVAITDAQSDALRAARLRNRGLTDCLRDSWKIGHPPAAYEDAAMKAEARGHYLFAARLWYLASCVSGGHKRAERYEYAAELAFAKIAA